MKKPTLTHWTAGVGCWRSWVFTGGVTLLRLTMDMTLLEKRVISISTDQDDKKRANLSRQCQTHHTLADITGTLYRSPLSSVIISDTRVDAACKQVK